MTHQVTHESITAALDASHTIKNPLEEGWPLGLQPLNVRVGWPRNGEFSGSISFNTLLTASTTSSTDSSSDLDTESTGSFFHDKSITLGSLIGVHNILDLSRRSIRGRKAEVENLGHQKKSEKHFKNWCLSLCSRASTDVVDSIRNSRSLAHFLAVERRSSSAEQ